VLSCSPRDDDPTTSCPTLPFFENIKNLCCVRTQSMERHIILTLSSRHPSVLSFAFLPCFDWHRPSYSFRWILPVSVTQLTFVSLLLLLLPLLWLCCGCSFRNIWLVVGWFLHRPFLSFYLLLASQGSASCCAGQLHCNVCRAHSV